MLARKATDQTLYGAGDKEAVPGSPQWAIAVRLQLQSYLKEHQSNVEDLEVAIRAMVKHEGWRHLKSRSGQQFESFEAFSRESRPWGLGYECGAIDEIIRERKSAQQLAEKARPLKPTKTAGPGRGRKTGSNTTRFSGKRDAEYLTARIKRDRPDILEKMKAGKYKSVRAAAKDAGIVKELSALEKMQRLWRKLGADEQEQFLVWVSEQ